MKGKKIITIVLMASVSISLLSGCKNKTSIDSGNTETSTQDGIKPFELSMLYCDSANYPYKPDWKILSIIKQHTGANLEVQAVPSSDYTAKQKIIFNSGEIPDIVAKTFASETDAMSGLLLPISQYEDQMPNYKKFIEEHNMRQGLDDTRLADGNYYTLPVNVHDSRIQNQQWLIRTDIFKKNNIPVPKTLEDVYEAGNKLKELYPESTPITNRFGAGNIMAGLSAGFGTIAGWTMGNGEHYDRSNNSWIFAPTTDNWKNMLMYANKLYENGILDQEFATLDSTVYEQRIVQGQTFIMYDWSSNIQRYNPQGKKNDPDFNVAPIYPVEGENGNHAVSWTAQWSQGWVLPSTLRDKDNFKDVLRFIDWCYTDEGKKLLTFGIEGETYKQEDGMLKYLDSNVDYTAVYGLNNVNLTVRQDEDAIFSALSQESRNLLNRIAKDNIIPLPNPASPLTADEIEQSNVYVTSLTDYTNTMMLKYIMGKESFDNWDKFIKECEGKGSIKLNNSYNNAWKNKNK